MKKHTKLLALTLAIAMLLSLGSFSDASGEASGDVAGSVPPAPPSAMAQNTEDMKNTAAISLVDGALASDEMAVSGGSVTASGVSGVFAEYVDIGDWDGSVVFGHYGLVLDNAEGSYSIGGAADVYDVEGFGEFNTVIALKADDRDAENALIPGQTRDYKDAQEGAEGAGVYAKVNALTVDNALIYTSGYGSSPSAPTVTLK